MIRPKPIVADEIVLCGTLAELTLVKSFEGQSLSEKFPILTRAARNPALDAHVVQRARLRTQARFDVAQTLTRGQSGKGHAEILIEEGKALDLVLSAMARDATTKRRQRHMLRDLRKHQLASVHQCPLRVSFSQDRNSTRRASNRDQEKS